MLLRINNWDEYFENNRSRGMRATTWVPIPNRLDGDGYSELLDHPEGAAHYGAWVAMVLMASKCHPRGTLVRDGGRPHDVRSLARISRRKPFVTSSTACFTSSAIPMTTRSRR